MGPRHNDGLDELVEDALAETPYEEALRRAREWLDRGEAAVADQRLLDADSYYAAATAWATYAGALPDAMPVHRTIVLDECVEASDVPSADA